MSTSTHHAPAPPAAVATARTEDADRYFMGLALAQARHAASCGEVPVGAVLVRNGEVIGQGHNQPVGSADPTAHAEIAALRDAARRQGNYRLDGCTLYVTLEPCCMCAGAILQARLARVVFGAAEPRSGAAGSVLDVFAQGQLNHHTVIQRGVLEDECSAVLQDFFRLRRTAQRDAAQPLRQDALRTPESAFAGLPLCPGQQHYVSHLPSLHGLRLHYLDAGSHAAPHTVVCLHATDGWSIQFAPLLAQAERLGMRVLAPDLIGFGLSDKPKRADWHSPEVHLQILREWMQELGLAGVTLLMSGSGDLWRMQLLQAMQDDPGNSDLAVNANADADRKAIDRSSASVTLLLFWPAAPSIDEATRLAPFPDRGHAAALRGMNSPGDATEQGDLILASDAWQRLALLGADGGLVRGVDALSIVRKWSSIERLAATRRSRQRRGKLHATGEPRGAPAPADLAAHTVPEHVQRDHLASLADALRQLADS